MPWNREPDHAGATAAVRRNARLLRRNQTPAEKRLWWCLRHKLSLDDTHFRRQFSIGPYIADFACLSGKLIVEVDGNQHGFDANRAADVARDKYLATQGFRVLRFSNFDVMRHVEVVLDTILAALEDKTPTPNPSPQGGGEM